MSLRLFVVHFLHAGIMADASFASLIQASCWQEVHITACINKTVVNDNAVSTFKRKEVEVLILLYNLLK